MLLHLVGVDDDVGGGVDGEQDVVDLDKDHFHGAKFGLEDLLCERYDIL